MGSIVQGPEVLGIGTAVADAVERAGSMLPLGDAVQLELIRDGLPGRDAAEAVRTAGRMGRPKGALNKRTLAWREYLTAQYAHPLEVLAQAISRPVETLAAELGCTKLEAMQMQLRSAAELAPYLESKMPVSVDVSTRSISLVIHGLDRAGAAPVEGDRSDVLTFAGAMLPPEQNQEVEP